MFIADEDYHAIRKYNTTSFTMSTVAGSNPAGYVDGPATVAKFNYPRGLALAPTGEIYVI